MNQHSAFPATRLLFKPHLSACSVSFLTMKAHKFLPFLLALAILPARAANEPDAGQICISVGRLLEQGHYTRKKLTEDGFSQKFLKNYLDFLDFNHLFFTQQDVDQFQTKYGNVVADDILLGNAAPAFELFDL